MSRPTKEAMIGEVNVPSVLANLVRIWTDNTLWNPTQASLPRWSRPSFTKDGRVHRGSLVHLLLRMDEFTSPSNLGNFHSGYGSYPQFSGLLNIGNGY